MKRSVIASLAALALTACSDAITSPTAPRVQMSRAASFTLDAPSIVHLSSTLDPVSGTYAVAFEVSWTSSGSQLPSYDHVSFDLRRSSVAPADKDSPEVAQENATGASTDLGTEHVATLTDVGVEPGTYYYCATVMAKDGFGSSTMTYHSGCSAQVEVVVGDEVTYTFVRIAAQNNATETPTSTTLLLNKNGDINVYLVLKADGSLVNDCSTVPVGSVTGSIVFTAHAAGPFAQKSVACAYNGASNRWVYQVTFPNAGINPAPNNAGSFDLKINGSTVTTYNFTTS